MYRAQVLTPWYPVGTGGDPSNRAMLGGVYAVSLVDDTGQAASSVVPDPNLFSVLVVCDLATLNAIDADADFYIQWWEEVVEDAP